MPVHRQPMPYHQTTNPQRYPVRGRPPIQRGGTLYQPRHSYNQPTYQVQQEYFTPIVQEYHSECEVIDDEEIIDDPEVIDDEAIIEDPNEPEIVEIEDDTIYDNNYSMENYNEPILEPILHPTLDGNLVYDIACLLYTSPSPRDS